MSVPGTGSRLQSVRARALAGGAFIVGELLIALPFLFVSPTTIRGVPGPLMIVLAIAASFMLGPWVGVVVTSVAVVLAVAVVGENALAEPLVWIPVSVAVGVLGDRVRRGEELRRALLSELRVGLVTVSRDPLVGPLHLVSRYVPAEQEQVLAGDFYGAIQAPSGTIELMVGDVAGHGPGAAAVATRLRAAWRGLASAGVPAAEAIRVLNDTLLAEQARMASPIPFATVCLASISTDQATASFLLAGHPAPILVREGRADPCAAPANPAIGVADIAAWRTGQVPLPDEPWSLILYTDGLVEGRASPLGPRPFGRDRLIPLLTARRPPLDDDDVDAVLGAVAAANGGPMADDVVVLAVSPV